MKKNTFIIVMIFVFGISFGQNALWRKIENVTSSAEKLPRDSSPKEFLLYSLDLNALKSELQNAPSRLDQSVASNIIVSFPNPEGEIQNYRIYDASAMHPELEAKYPGIKSYVGKGIEDPTATIRFSVTLFGLHTMTFSGVNETSYIDPYTKDLQNYIVYNKSQLITTKTHICGVKDSELNVEELPEDLTLMRSSNSLFKTYRLAMACTIEYAAYHVNAAGMSGGTLAQKKAAVLSAMVVTMTRVNGVYERDLALTMQLIPNNDAIINITSDTLDNNNTSNALLNQIQAYIDGIIGATNYDIGHVVSTGGGGVASLQSPCSGIKAQGVTGLDAPVGDNYDIDFVAHEMGHQWGGSHTFNSESGNCGGGNRSAPSAYEPGSGTTIMAYAGICSPEDVQPHSDAYMHARSLIQMMAFINAGGNCGVVVANNNTPPVLDAGGNNSIPTGTPFKLTGSATDVDNPTGDQLTYCWEHYNFLSAAQPLAVTNTGGPNFRSFNPTTSPIRYFPKLANVVANNLATGWEFIPTVARTMTFSLVVRDNGGPLGGQTQRVTKTVTLVNTGAQFKVTSQSTTTGWPQNSLQTITWDVAGTDANGINVASVNIKLSTDGGLTYPITLLEGTPNDGSQEITVPDLVSQTARVMVEAVGNVFFAINSKNINIGYQVVNVCTTYGTNIAAYNLPDGATSYTSKQISVPTAGTISDVNLTVNATHPNIQNLMIALIRPGGSLSLLYNQQCAGSGNMNVTFDAQGTALVCSSPTIGTYIPPTGFNLDTFNGFSQLGTWQLGIRDAVAGNAGTINSIALEICSQTLVPLATQTFGFENFTLYPNPNSGNFTVQFDSKSNNKINIKIHDLSGRKIFDKQYENSGLFTQNLQLDNAQSGIYLVSISEGDNKIVKRIVVE
jgi:subtilisin-like proprotein convertase family protein